jgi:hypothetical protein
MISNERRWPSHRNFQRQPYFEQPHSPAPRPTLREDTLESREIQIERKHFLVMLKENPRGRFLRISEETNGRYNSIMIPGDGLQEFLKMLEGIVSASEAIPPSSQPAEPGAIS